MDGGSKQPNWTNNFDIVWHFWQVLKGFDIIIGM